MPLLPRKGILAITAVIEIAAHARGAPLSAKTLAARYGLPLRHFEPVLQALVRQGILKGVRGPGAGCSLARERRRISAEDILHAAGSTDEEIRLVRTRLLDEIVLPALGQAEQAFAAALAGIDVEELIVAAKRAHKDRPPVERSSL